MKPEIKTLYLLVLQFNASIRSYIFQLKYGSLNVDKTYTFNGQPAIDLITFIEKYLMKGI